MHIPLPKRNYNMLVVGLLLICCYCNSAFAVDRSKFRTCEQTSFCRRNRQHADGTPNHSHILYHYKVVPDSVHFHVVSGKEKEEAGAAGEPLKKPSETEDKKESAWKSWSRRLLGTSGSGDSKNSKGKEENIPGPPPTLTAVLQNTAAKNADSSASDSEFLRFSLTTLRDGVARIRITEIYGSTPETQYPRVTYDHLVLHQPETWKPAREAVWHKKPTATADGAAPPPPNDAFLQNLQKKLKLDLDNTMAIQFSDQPEDAAGVSGSLIILQLDPFQVSLYRLPDLEVGPLVQLNAQDLMHFEIRRNKDSTNNNSNNKAAASKAEQEDKEEDKPKEEKEIVGYWEDGLAIYADGTREQRKEVKEADADHRQLTEEEEKVANQEGPALDPNGLWEEEFSGHKDTKPYGPMSVGMDVSFPTSRHLYGIPEHASSAILQGTRGTDAHYKEPYRLYNLDVFEYELDETMALYGSIPLLISHSEKSGSVGVFWFNPTETFVDVVLNPAQGGGTTDTAMSHWISESGVVDIFLLPGPDPASLYHQYAKLTGTNPLPPMFSLGYHQCRWNYKDEKDVAYVHSKFEELDYPYDVLWLDIEHTDGKRYFTWDKGAFPNPEHMQLTLAAQGRRMVTIIDPHIKRDDNYYIHKEATSKGLYIKDKEGRNDYDGWCWPGSSSYLDFTAEHVRSWWADQFHYGKYKGSTSTLFTWNDMNEPSVFNGPEVSMSKDLKNLLGEEHREWHNIYGMLFHRATSEGLIRRNQPTENFRPFVLSRAFFAGSQRYGAIWTGDNAAQWGHLEIAAPMLLSMNAAALTFVGADVGGFFGNPDAELFTRWMQAGAFTPFFRGHAHHDAKRREPWTFDDATLNRLRRAAMIRYALLPFWYTVFHNTETTGMPIMRMMWMEYPKTAELFAVENQYLVSSDLLVKPITSPGVTETDVLFPTDHLWYDAESLVLVSSKIAPRKVESKKVPADIDTIPVFQRGGSIVPRKLRLRRSSMLMKHDPYTLYVALDQNQQAIGDLYMDDEETFGYARSMEYANATITADLRQGTIRNAATVGSGWADFVDDLAANRMIERIIVMGVQKPVKKVSIAEGGAEIVFTYNKESKVLILRKPELSAMAEWTIKLS